MYLKQTCSIEFETKDGTKYRLRGLHSYEDKKSVHQSVQTCKIQLPVSIIMQNKDLPDVVKREKLINKIKEGDKVTVFLGYNGKNVKEFEGYIKRINPKQPLELELEDEMYLLRKIRLKKSFKKADVSEVIQYILDETFKQTGVRFERYAEMPKVDVHNFWMNEANGITVLQELEDKYLLSSFLTEIDGKKTLYCGLMYGLKTNTVKYEFGRNTISIDDLKYNGAGDRTFKVEIRHVDNSGHETKHEYGDAKGEVQKILLEGNWTKEALKHYADGVIQGLQAGGYKGSFTTFLIPRVQPTNVIDAKDPQFVERSATFYCSTVETKFGSGATRKPEIEIRL
jgi:hypothetical protein